MMWPTMRVTRWTASVVLVLAMACGSTSGSSTPSTQGPAPSVAPTLDVWVAVLRVDEVPGALSADRDAVLETLGDALEGAVVVSPVGCLEGLPAGLPSDGYVLAIQQGSRAEVRVLAAQLPDEPRFVGPIRLLCTD
jgi:hypothetical protein